MALVTAYEVPRAEPVIVAVAHQPPAVANTNTMELNDCNCGVPATVSKPVKVTRRISGLIIVIHVAALFYDQVFWGQRVASIIATATGGAVLCQFNKWIYVIAAVLYTISAIFDILTVLFWIMHAEALAEDIADDDIEKDQAERTIKLSSLTPAVGAVCLLLGVITASKAAHSWQNSGAHDMATVIESRIPVRFPNSSSAA